MMGFASDDILFEVPMLLASRQMMKAVREMRRFVEDHPFEGAIDTINGVENDYLLMLDYARQGYQDPSRVLLYRHLQSRLYRLCIAMQVRHWRNRLPFFVNACMPSVFSDMTNDRLKEQLEGFVSNQAMLSLEPEESQQEKSVALHKEHHELISDIFNHLVASFPWNEQDQVFYEELLVSPTIDPMDAQLIVSALMISVIQSFDIQKFTTLLHVYQRSTDEYVRQRALVGWTFALQSDDLVTDEAQCMVREACSDPKVLQEVIDLQEQMVFCIKTRKDTEAIQKEIFPNIIKNNNFTISRDGIITEKEDDVLEDILHPDEEENRMEEVEKSVHKMMEMQKAGSDIYFGGFSHMKKYPFFYKSYNWFCPFSLDHPALSNVSVKLKSSGFLKNLMLHGPFCDSDKYSFALSMSTVFDRLSDSIREMMGDADSLGPVMDEHQMHEAAYIRRMYLQDLYRFYSLNENARGLKNPFERKRVVFVEYQGFHETGMMERYPDICTFFIKHDCQDAFSRLEEVSKRSMKSSHRMVYAAWYLKHHICIKDAIRMLKEVLEKDPSNELALRNLARAYYLADDMEQACKTYKLMCEKYPSKPSYALNYAIVLSKLNRYDDAVNLLFQLDYEHPSKDVTRCLAWALMGQHKLEQAGREYQKLLDSSPAHIDYLNAGYCQWFLGNLQQATTNIRLFIRKMKEDGETVNLKQEMDNDEYMLRSNGMSDVDKGILLDLVQN